MRPAIIMVALAATVLLGGCHQTLPVSQCVLPDTTCYIDQAMTGLHAIRDTISLWSGINLAGHVLVVSCSIISTVIIALQGDNNRQWTRPIGLVTTALATGITSALVSFHVPENIDRLVEILGEMNQVVSDYKYQADLMRAGRSDAELQATFRTDKALRAALSELTHTQIGRYNALHMDTLRLAGSAAKINDTANPAAPGPRSGATPDPARPMN